MGEDYPEVKYPAQPPNFSGLPQTLSNTLLLLAALNDRLTPCIVQWYTPYLYGKYSTSSNFSSMGHPPSCLATKSMAHS